MQLQGGSVACKLGTPSDLTVNRSLFCLCLRGSHMYTGNFQEGDARFLLSHTRCHLSEASLGTGNPQILGHRVKKKTEVSSNWDVQGLLSFPMVREQFSHCT